MNADWDCLNLGGRIAGSRIRCQLALHHVSATISAIRGYTVAYSRL